MNVYRPDQIRTVAVIAHGGAGKSPWWTRRSTTRAPSTRIGKVDEGTSISDYDADEIKRRMSINLTVVPVEWRGRQDQSARHPGLRRLHRRGDGGAARGRRRAGGGLGGERRRGRHRDGLEARRRAQPAAAGLHQQARPREHELRVARSNRCATHFGTRSSR